MNLNRWILVFVICFSASTKHSDAQWAQLSNLGGRNVLAFTALGSRLYAGTDLGVYSSTNGGATWTPRNAGLPNLSVTSLWSSQSRLLAAAGNWVFSSADSGSVWTLSSTGLTAEGISSFLVKDSVLFAGGLGGVFRSTDNGNNWTAANVGLTLGNVTSLAVLDNYLLAAGDSGLCRSSNNGTTWAPIGASADSALVLKSAYSITPFGAILFAGLRFRLRTAQLTQGGIYASTDDGMHWALRGFSGFNVFQVGTYKDRIIASTGYGIYFSQNNGFRWVSCSDGLPSYQNLNTFFVSGTDILAGTISGVWRRPLSELVTGVEREGNEMPRSVALLQNYPNPFNPTTAISYQLSANSFVKLVVSDMLGREIATIVSENQQPGAHMVQWNASYVPSGVYFYRLQAGGYVETKKMILLR